jgi:hypothetical protein
MKFVRLQRVRISTINDALSHHRVIGINRFGESRRASRTKNAGANLREARRQKRTPNRRNP